MDSFQISILILQIVNIVFSICVGPLVTAVIEFTRRIEYLTVVAVMLNSLILMKYANLLQSYRNKKLNIMMEIKTRFVLLKFHVFFALFNQSQ